MSKLVGKLLIVMMLCGWMGGVTAGPITDIVTVDGKDWAQVDLFLNVSWYDMNSVCPSGNCGSGSLNGYDMAGWTWASVDQLNTLLNGYLIGAGISGNNLLVGPDWYAQLGFPQWAEAFLADGWRPTSVQDGEHTLGLTSSLDIGGRAFAGGLTYYTTGQDAGHAGFDSRELLPSEFEYGARGAWFFRTEVPLPATIPLLILGLAALVYSRRNRRRQN